MQSAEPHLCKRVGLDLVPTFHPTQKADRMISIINLEEFTRGLKLDAEELEEEVAVTTRKVAFDILQGLVFASPVDTGRFRGNWQVDVGRLSEINITGEVDTLDRNGAATIAKALGKLRFANPFDAAVIQNNVEYGEKLNSGSSRQAPAGFVEASIDRALLPFS